MSADAAQQFIRSRYGNRAGELSALGAGEWSRAFAFTLDGRRMVARFGRHGEDFAKDAVMAAHSSPGLPIPRVFQVGAATEGFFAISERADGRFLDALDAAGMRQALPALLRALDAARAIDVSATTGYGNWSAEGSVSHRSWPEALLDIAHDPPGSRTHGWRAALSNSPTGDGPFHSGIEALESLVYRCPARREVIHGDLLNRNVLVDGANVAAVLDWGNSRYGDGVYDLAWLAYWWPWYPAWSTIDIRREIAAHLPAEPDLEDRLRCYQIHIGLDAQAYNAFTGRFDELAINAAQTLALLG